jgi:hypothetical protein
MPHKKGKKINIFNNLIFSHEGSSWGEKVFLGRLKPILKKFGFRQRFDSEFS